MFRLALALSLGMMAAAPARPQQQQPEAVRRFQQQHPEKNYVLVGSTRHASALQDDVKVVLAGVPGQNGGRAKAVVIRPGETQDFRLDQLAGKVAPGEWVWFNGNSRQQTTIKGATTVIVERGKNGALQWYGLKAN